METMRPKLPDNINTHARIVLDYSEIADSLYVVRTNQSKEKVMFLLSRVTWYDNGCIAVHPTAVADNVPALQTWAQKVETITVEWESDISTGLVRTKPVKFGTCQELGTGQELWSISKIISL